MRYLKLYENFESRPEINEYSNEMSSSDVFDYISNLHNDMEDTNIYDRVFKFSTFKLKQLDLKDVNADEFHYDDDLVDSIAKIIKQRGTYPPIVFDSEENQIIDGTHRCQALLKLGATTVWAYVGEDLDPDFTVTYGEENDLYENKESEFPKLSWVKTQLKWNSIKQMKKKVLGAYIVGSVAKGTANKNSDLDIAVIIEPIKNKTALKFTEEYHENFDSDKGKPKWDNKVVDFQFFYPEDEELNTYSKIELK